MSDFDPGRIRRILLRANNWIGDVVMIGPAVRAIRERFPAARIVIVAKPWVCDVLRDSPFFDELLEYDRSGRHAGLSGRLRLARDLRRGGPIDLAVLFQKAFEAALLARLAGARLRVGYASDRRTPLLTHALPLPAPGTHHADAFLELARFVGCTPHDARPVFHVGAGEQSRAAALLRDRGFLDAPLMVALHPGASKPQRAWHAERYGLLAARLHGERSARFLLVGGAGERALLAQVASGLPPGTFLGPETAPGLRDAAALLERCHLFVGNDSGPMHLAAALGVPTLGLFGPGSPRSTAPRGRPGSVLTLGGDYPCSPCRQDFFRECPPAPSGKPFCLEEIRVETVFEAALALLQPPQRAPEEEAAPVRRQPAPQTP
jgi:lipopolysaccharide heptosyltransferase II